MLDKNWISKNTISLGEFFLLFFSAISISVLANQHESMPHSMDHSQSKVGIHGMVIFAVDDQLFASHMPLVNSIHAHQIIFSFQVDSKVEHQIKLLLSAHNLVTLMPERFDLNNLMSGSLTSFSGQVFSGHFERGGKVSIKNANVDVERIHLNEMMAANKNGSYWVVPVSDKASLLVHKIALAPSFDQILSTNLKSIEHKKISDKVNPKSPFELPLELTLKNTRPIENDSVAAKELTHALAIRHLYLETRDFLP